MAASCSIRRPRCMVPRQIKRRASATCASLLTHRHLSWIWGVSIVMGVSQNAWFRMENLAAETHTGWFVSTQSHCFLFFHLYTATSWYHHQLNSLYLLVYNYPTLQIYHYIYIYVCWVVKFITPAPTLQINIYIYIHHENPGHPQVFLPTLHSRPGCVKRRTSFWRPLRRWLRSFRRWCRNCWDSLGASEGLGCSPPKK